LTERSGRLGEALAIVDAMLTNETVDFIGEHYTVHELPSLPAPVQQPRPPIHVGGISVRHTLPLVARYGDVWNVPTYGLAVWEERSRALDEACEAIGRDPTTVRRSHEAVLVLAADETALATALEKASHRYAGPGWGLEDGGYVGTPQQLVDHIGAMRARGIDEFVFFPSDRGTGDTLDLLAEQVLPHLD
jgi:alkanesulfonate monooxygenase SsuD/methylene tetrahydromethanopterin reductase-like flavin-dependent oxidoreductase (luciferase family)